MLSFDSLPTIVESLQDRIAQLEMAIKTLSKPDSAPEYLNANQAAAFLGITRNALGQKVHQNTLPFIKKGTRLYFKKSELISWVESGARKQKSK